jgi:hypothetical protein
MHLESQRVHNVGMEDLLTAINASFSLPQRSILCLQEYELCVLKAYNRYRPIAV